jgi:hypothetical protein
MRFLVLLFLLTSKHSGLSALFARHWQACATQAFGGIIVIIGNKESLTQRYLEEIMTIVEYHEIKVF